MSDKDKDKGNGTYEWTRRRFMQTAGAGALAATTLVGAKPASGEQHEVEGEQQPTLAGSTPDYDAIVIGAGFTGATAARELSELGLQHRSASEPILEPPHLEGSLPAF